MIDSMIQSKDPKALGVHLAQVHRQPLLIESRVLLDGRHIYLRGCMMGMPRSEEIEEAVIKLDGMVNQITSTETHPFVILWGKGGKKISPSQKAYGNPAWDLGIVINFLQEASGVEDFLQQYLESEGVLVTLIELYAGTIYAMLNEAIVKHDEAAWRRLAKNECLDVIQNNEFELKVLSSEAIARLGLPGLRRG